MCSTAVPPVLKEATYGLGCTTWEVFKHVILPYTRVGVIGGVMLGPRPGARRDHGRHVRDRQCAQGVGLDPGARHHDLGLNRQRVHRAVGDLYTSSLIALGLILFVITFIVLAVARYMLLRIQRRLG
jgi:phosphate transport system permease protein